MQPIALSVSPPGGGATAQSSNGAEAGDGLSSLLGAGQFLEAVIEHIPAVVFVKDASDFRFILLNRAGEEFLGVQRKPSSAGPTTTCFPRRRPIGSWRATARC